MGILDLTYKTTEWLVFQIRDKAYSLPFQVEH